MAWQLDSGTADLMVAVRKAAAALGDPDPVERPRHSLEMLGLVDRCKSLFAATHLLLERGFVHEAVILDRPLFTDSLFLAEYASVDEQRRVELVIGWSKASIASLESLFRDGAADAQTLAARRTQSAARHKELEEYARRHNARSKRWQPDEHAKDLAIKHGREDGFRTLVVVQQFVHGATSATAGRYSKVAEDTVEVGGPAVDLDSWAEAAGLFAADSMLHATRAACRIFDWQEPLELDDLFQQVERAAENLE